VEKTVFQNNISNNTLNIINNSELTLISPKIKDKEKTILNEKYMLLRESPELESKIYGGGKIEIVGQIPEDETFDFGYLDKKIHENNPNTIVLEQDICLENYERDYYEGGIELDINNLVIDGNGKTINGADKSRIFIITGKNITLKNIIFKNGRSHNNYNNPRNTNGGAIKINSNAIVSLINCKFINNLSESDGGAIENNGNLTLKKSVITDNIGKYAIYNKGMLNMFESTLNNNTGAILNRYELNISDASIKNNRRGISNYGKLIVNNSILSEQDYSAISNSGKLRISDSVLSNNKSGAISNSGELSIIKSRFNNNVNDHFNGGAISNWGKLTITESTLSYNKAKNGGAIWTKSMENLDLIDCEFLQNRPNDIPDDKGYYRY
jgi:predicted outer membrane repeat protein